jgi:hypothetical protein
MNVRSLVRRPVLAAVAAAALAGATSVVAGASTAHALGTDYVCAGFGCEEEGVLYGHGCEAYYANHAPTGVLFQYRGERQYVFECVSAHPSPQDETEVLGLVCHPL